MNSDPDNLPDLVKKDPQNSSDLDQIEELIEFLVEGDISTSNSSSESAVSAQNLNSLSEENFKSPQEDSSKNFNFIEQLDSANSELNSAEIKVEIQSEHIPTLAEAVAYEAFLRQTVESQTASAIENLDSIEQLEAIDTENATPEDLADAVNSLIPLIVRLLESKIDNSPDSKTSIRSPHSGTDSRRFGKNGSSDRQNSPCGN